MSDPAGRLNIHLRRTPTGLQCTIDSSRPVTAASLMRGRSVAEAAALLPMLFAICAKAQAYAGVGALESATGAAASPEVWRLRRLALKVETVREHLWRMLLDWPCLLEEPPDRTGLAALLPKAKALFALLDPGERLFQPGARDAELDGRAWPREVAGLEDLIAQQVLGVEAETWLEQATDLASFARWAELGATAPARLIGAIRRADEASLGRSEVEPLPAAHPAELAEHMLASDGADFLARPSWGGAPRETSPFTRNAGLALIRTLVDVYGNGLLPRLAAQVVEVASLAVELRRTVSTHQDSANEAVRLAPGLGLGQAEAARGRLVHAVRVADGRIADYRILAPTEWNFHPQGCLARGLGGLPAASPERLRSWAERLILSIDPCVAYALTLDPIAPDGDFVS
jgi:uptake hydrogenase large subunit